MGSCAFLILLWLVYIVLSILDASGGDSTVPDANSTLLVAMAPSPHKTNLEVSDSKWVMWSSMSVLFGATMYLSMKGRKSVESDDEYVKV